MARIVNIHYENLNDIVFNDVYEVIKDLNVEIQTSHPRYCKCLEDSLDLSGKFKRPVLLYLSCLCTENIIKDSTRYIAASIEIMHNASLIHDDIIDEGYIRREKDSIYKKYGIPSAILSGDYLIFTSINMVSNAAAKCAKRDEILNLLINTYREMCIGQFMEDQLVSDLEVDIETYFKVIRLKTANFFSAICSVGGLLQEASDDESRHLAHFGLCMGMAYQIRDDVLNYIYESHNQNKPVDLDSKRKLVTLPVLLAYRKASLKDKNLLFNNYSSNKAIDHDEVKGILFKTSAIKKTLAYIDRYTKDARVSLSKLRESAARNQLLSYLDSLQVKNMKVLGA